MTKVPDRGNPRRIFWSLVPRPSHQRSAYVIWHLPAGDSGDLSEEFQLAQCPVKNSQLHHSMSTISTPNAHPTSTR